MDSQTSVETKVVILNVEHDCIPLYSYVKFKNKIKFKKKINKIKTGTVIFAFPNRVVTVVP